MSASFVKGFTVREGAWHKMAHVKVDYFDLTDPAQLEEAIREAGHDEEAEAVPVFVPRHGYIYVETLEEVNNLRAAGYPADRVLTWKQAAEAEANDSDVTSYVTTRSNGERVAESKPKAWQAIVSRRSGRVHNITRDSYEIVQFRVLWELVQAFAGRADVRVETAGLLKDGAVGWVLGVVDDEVRIPGDSSSAYPYFMASAAHDGSGAARIDVMSIRTVCMNTYQAALSQVEGGHGKSFAANLRATEEGTSFTFRHTKSVHERIEQAKDAISVVRAKHHEYAQLGEELAAIPMDEAHVGLFVDNFIAMPQDKLSLVSKRVQTNVENARGEVWKILNGPTSEGIRNTAWGCVQAGVEYLDHVRRSRSPETYFTRNLLRADPLKAQLVPFVRELAELPA